jgi:hypothetical protein
MQCRQEGADLGPCDRIVLDKRQKHTDPPNVIGLLRLYCERPRRRSAEQRDERAPLQSIELHLLPLARAAAYRIGGDQVRGLLRCEISTRLTAAWSAPLGPDRLRLVISPSKRPQISCAAFARMTARHAKAHRPTYRREGHPL